MTELTKSKMQFLMDGFAKIIDGKLLINEARGDIEQLFLDKNSVLHFNNDQFVKLENSIIIKKISKKSEVDEFGPFLTLTYTELNSDEFQHLTIYGTRSFYVGLDRLLSKLYIL